MLQGKEGEVLQAGKLLRPEADLLCPEANLLCANGMLRSGLVQRSGTCRSCSANPGPSSGSQCLV